MNEAQKYWCQNSLMATIVTQQKNKNKIPEKGANRILNHKRKIFYSKGLLVTIWC